MNCIINFTNNISKAYGIQENNTTIGKLEDSILDVRNAFNLIRKEYELKQKIARDNLIKKTGAI